MMIQRDQVTMASTMRNVPVIHVPRLLVGALDDAWEDPNARWWLTGLRDGPA
jgi:hypothetical protein